MAGRSIAVAAVVGCLALAGCSATGALAPVAAQSSPASPGSSAPTRAPAVPPLKDVPYAGTDDPRQTLDVCLPAASAVAHSALLLIHGGGWEYGDKSELGSLCGSLADAGFAVFDLDYRLAPAVRYPVPLNDVRDALAWVVAHASEYDVDPERIGVFGSSAGGHLAVQLAATGNLDSPTRLKAVVDLSGPVDLTAAGQKKGEDPRLVRFMLALLGCASLAACPNAAVASPVDHVAAGDPPVFIVHSQDDFVPAAQGRELAERLTAVGTEATLVVESGGSHAEALLVGHPALKDRVVAFLRDHLG